MSEHSNTRIDTIVAIERIRIWKYKKNMKKS